MKDMALLIDTNVVLDWMLDREPFQENAKKVMEYCIRGEMQGYLASHTILNVFYIVRKDMSIDERKEILLFLCNSFSIIGIDRLMIVQTLQRGEWGDLEDGLQMLSAAHENLDYIVTRDTKCFTASAVKILSPEELIELIKIET